jgi:hypothetical protein
LKKWIFEPGAKPVQRVAHGRLGKAYRRPSAADMSFSVHRIEGFEEVEVERIYIHWVNLLHSIYPFQQLRAAH